MNNSKKSCCFQSSSLNEMKQVNSPKSYKCFSDKNGERETASISNSKFNEFPSRSNANVRKISHLGNLVQKQTNKKNIISSYTKGQSERIKNDLKTKQPKVSLIPRPSFINSSKLLYCSRSTQLNARKELIKKMVLLAECTLKENQMNKSTPVKLLAGLTPKKTPRSGGYFVLPEFKKKVPKLEDIKSPIEDFIKKEMFSYSANSLKENISPKFCKSLKSSCPNLKDKKVMEAVGSSPDFQSRLNQVLYHCKNYSKEVSCVHETLRILDEAFERKLGEIPEYKVYNEFCLYQLKKEDLYRDLRIIDEDFRNSITSKMNISNKFKIFLKRKEELLGKQKDLLKDFEQVIQNTVNKYVDVDTKILNLEEERNEGTPKLRRSLRLSNISKKNEKTPMTKKLKKLDTKSRRIQKRETSVCKKF